MLFGDKFALLKKSSVSNVKILFVPLVFFQEGLVINLLLFLKSDGVQGLLFDLFLLSDLSVILGYLCLQFCDTDVEILTHLHLIFRIVNLFPDLHSTNPIHTKVKLFELWIKNF